MLTSGLGTQRAWKRGWQVVMWLGSPVREHEREDGRWEGEIAPRAQRRLPESRGRWSSTELQRWNSILEFCCCDETCHEIQHQRDLNYRPPAAAAAATPAHAQQNNPKSTSPLPRVNTRASITPDGKREAQNKKNTHTHNTTTTTTTTRSKAPQYEPRANFTGSSVAHTCRWSVGSKLQISNLKRESTDKLLLLWLAATNARQ